MRVAIVTVYKSPNSGSYLQAWALSKAISFLGYETFFLNTGTRKPMLTTSKQCISLLLKGEIKQSLNSLRRLKNFCSSWKRFKTIKLSSKNKIDAYILGSDEIWNMQRKEMSKYDIFWGIGLDLNKTIAYSPTMNGASKELFRSNLIVNSLNNINQISVRDGYTKTVVDELTNRNVKITCDPTLLIDVSEYRRIQSNCIDNNKYILIYMPNNMAGDLEIRVLKEFAKKNKLKLVSFHYYNDWCDEVIPAKPEMFLEYIDKAKYVITTTFHGTMFSIIYNKQFLAFEKGNLKTNELLTQFGLADRMLKITDDSCINLIDKEINYQKVNIFIDGLREQSIEYLNSGLNDLLNTSNK